MDLYNYLDEQIKKQLPIAPIYFEITVPKNTTRKARKYVSENYMAEVTEFYSFIAHEAKIILKFPINCTISS